MASTLDLPVMAGTDWKKITDEKKHREAEQLVVDQKHYNSLLEEYCDSLKDRIKNNKILFVKPIHLHIDAFEPEVAKNRSYYAYPPTGLQYLDAAIDGRGLESRIIDINFELLDNVRKDNSFDYKNWLSILDKELNDFDPSIIGISNHFTIDFEAFIETLEFLKDRNRVVIGGGQNATYEFEKLFKNDLCHFVCQRESENKLNFLLDHFYPSINSKPTPGILFKFHEEIIESRGEVDKVQLKGNMINAHKKIPFERYSEVGSLSPYSRMAGTPFATVQFNRGCQAACRFCGVHDFMGIGVRSRSVDDILDEMQFLYDNGIKHFELLDDDFFRYRTNAMEVLNGIKDKKLDITWASNNGIIARTLDEESLALMVETGCLGFKIGVETGNAERLREVKKPGTLPEFLIFSDRAQKFPSMFIVDNYIIGLPNETFAQMIESYNFGQKMNLDWSQFAVYQENVACFGYKELQKKKKDNTIGDFIPTKGHYLAMLEEKDDLLTGLNIFKNLPRDTIPSHSQAEMLWLVIDFGKNYVNNKNLKSNGNPKKFLKWVDMVQLRYPTHPYINMYINFARRLLGDDKEADNQYKSMNNNLYNQENKDYWEKRFKEQGLWDIVKDFPHNKRDVESTLNVLRERYTLLI